MSSFKWRPWRRPRHSWRPWQTLQCRKRPQLWGRGEFSLSRWYPVQQTRCHSGLSRNSTPSSESCSAPPPPPLCLSRSVDIHYSIFLFLGLSVDWQLQITKICSLRSCSLRCCCHSEKDLTINRNLQPPLRNTTRPPPPKYIKKQLTISDSNEFPDPIEENQKSKTVAPKQNFCKCLQQTWKRVYISSGMPSLLPLIAAALTLGKVKYLTPSLLLLSANLLVWSNVGKK